MRETSRSLVSISSTGFTKQVCSQVTDKSSKNMHNRSPPALMSASYVHPTALSFELPTPFIWLHVSVNTVFPLGAMQWKLVSW